MGLLDQGRIAPSSRPSKGSTTHFSTVRSKVRSGAIRIDITDSEQWSAGDVAVIRNQEAKKVRDIGSLIFETPIQHDYEEGVEVRSLLSTEELEEIDGRLAVLDVDPSTGTRFVKFWVDETPLNATAGDPAEGRRSNAPGMSRDVSHITSAPERRERGSPVHDVTERDRNRESPDFGGGVDYHEYETPQRERIPLGGSSNEGRERIPNDERATTNLERISPKLLQKIRFPEDVLYTLWNC